MKIYKSLARVAGSAALLGSLVVAPGCTDDIKFGSAFIEKAPDGLLNVDLAFSNPEYVEQALTACYSTQYYGLPYGGTLQWSASCYRGKLDGFTDLYTLNWDATTLWNAYYIGTLSANENGLIAFIDDKVWTAVRRCLQFIENVDRCEGLSDYAKKRYKAEAKCIIVSRYFDLFTTYGGLPIIEKTFDGSETSFPDCGRQSVEETVEYMVNKLDEAIADLPWAYDGTNAEATIDEGETENRARWSRAGAMALKAKILTFAASPLFNNDKPYYDGTTEAETKHCVWYGNYDPARWTRALKACEDFFAGLAEGGYYALEQAKGKDVESYRLAYRKGYLRHFSREHIHTVRVRQYDNWANGYYNWSNWVHLGRNSYLPTYEYMSMFGWKDGEAFDWDKDQGKIFGSKHWLTGLLTGAKLFYSYSSGGNKTASRDPRLYENMIVNGMSAALDWTTAATTGNEYELWVGGYHAGNTTVTQEKTKCYATGFGVMKYDLGPEGVDYQRLPLQWVTLGLSEMYLMYAECLAQTGDLKGALDQVQVVRKRVGLTKDISKDKSGLDVLGNKDDMIEAILRERACELGMSNNRYYDMVRYMRTDWMTKQLHGLRTYRLNPNDLDEEGNMKRSDKPYIGDEKNAAGGNNTQHPTNFDYEIFELNIPAGGRYLWRFQDDADNLEVRKWFLSPFPASEVNKGYGLIQNPGW